MTRSERRFYRLIYGISFGCIFGSFLIAKDMIFSKDPDEEAAKSLIVETSIMVQGGHYEEAIRTTQKILTLGELEWEAYYYKAIAHLHRKELQEAYQATLKMQDLTPYGQVTMKGFDAMKNTIKAIGENRKDLIDNASKFCVNFVELSHYRNGLDLDISGEKCFGKYRFYKLYNRERKVD